jgi:hypothetical protein
MGKNRFKLELKNKNRCKTQTMLVLTEFHFAFFLQDEEHLIPSIKIC